MASESDIQQSIHTALQANKDHQYALRIYSERIDAELESLNKLLAAADVSDPEEDTLEVNAGGWVAVPDATEAVAPISSADLLHHASPFRDAALRRQRYVDATVMHQWRPSDLEALSDAVKSENHRLYAVEAQLRGQQGLPRQTEDMTKFVEENTTGIDWERVSAKVSKSSLSSDFRSAKACEIKWVGERHPRFNDSQWTQPEVDRVKELVAGRRPGQVNWVDVAKELGTGRTPLDCMRHAIHRRIHVWDADSDQRLRDVVETYGTDNWIYVARLVSEDATPQQCQNRWIRYLDPRIKREPFTEEEDRLLRNAAAVYGNAWNDIAPFLAGRTNEQCRERTGELNSVNTKRKWTDEEDRILLEATEDAEVIDFKEVASTLGSGRTEVQARNRYAALMRRINRMAASSSSQTLRPILPAPSLQPIAGPSKPPPQPAARPPGTFRPILPAPARPLEVGQIAYPGLAAQSYPPPPIAPRVQGPVPESLHMIDPALWPSQYAGAAQGPASGSTAASQGEAGPRTPSEAPSQGVDVAPSSSQPQPSRPRPRPRRKRAVDSNPALVDASSQPMLLPDDTQAPSAEAVAPTRRKGKGKAMEPAREADEHEEGTSPQAQTPSTRTRQGAVDKQPSKKKATKKRTASGVIDRPGSTGATNEVGAPTPGQTSMPGDASLPNASPGSQQPGSTGPTLAEGYCDLSAMSGATSATNVPTAGAEAGTTSASTSGGGKKVRRPNPRTPPTAQPPARRSTRLQHAKAGAPLAPSEEADGQTSIAS